MVYSVCNYAVYNSSFRCEFGVLNTCYGEGDLERYEGDLSLTTEDWESLPKLSLREAAMKSNPKNDFSASRCQCKTMCSTASCTCRKRGVPCTSKCHKGSKCKNQDGGQLKCTSSRKKNVSNYIYDCLR